MKLDRDELQKQIDTGFKDLDNLTIFDSVSMYRGAIKEKNYSKHIYLSTLPKWLQFMLFMHQGVISDVVKLRTFKILRMLCWFDKHQYKLIKPVKWIACERCHYQITSNKD